MKIYTKTGDKGKTSLVTGTRVSKDHVRIEAYGTVDELNAHLGLLRAFAPGGHACQVLLLQVQDRLFAMGSWLAKDEKEIAFALPRLQPDDIPLLERAMDAMDAELPPLRNFVLPGGDAAVAQCHVCRTVCRRAERRVVQLGQQGLELDPEHVRYLNRLSDYLFVLSRKLAQDLGVVETPWKPSAT